MLRIISRFRVFHDHSNASEIQKCDQLEMATYHCSRIWISQNWISAIQSIGKLQSLLVLIPIQTFPLPILLHQRNTSPFFSTTQSLTRLSAAQIVTQQWKSICVNKRILAIRVDFGYLSRDQSYRYGSVLSSTWPSLVFLSLHLAGTLQRVWARWRITCPSDGMKQFVDISIPNALLET